MLVDVREGDTAVLFCSDLADVLDAAIVTTWAVIQNLTNNSDTCMRQNIPAQAIEVVHAVVIILAVVA